MVSVNFDFIFILLKEANTAGCWKKLFTGVFNMGINAGSFKFLSLSLQRKIKI